MKQIRRILVAIKDTDTRTQPAIEKAALLARRLGASVELFHAIAEPVYFDSANGEAKLEDLRERRRDWHLGRLQITASRLCETGVKACASADWDFPVYEAIIRRALAMKADLIVADSHTHSRLTRWFMHLTDWELIRLSPVPVLLVKTRELYERPIVLAAVDPMHAHAKPAKLDKAILDYGNGIARALSGSLHALHARFPLPLDIPPSEIVSDPQFGILQTRLEQKARAAFATCANKARVPHARQHFVNGNPTVVLPEKARSLGADLVVMGAVSRSGLRRIFIGNTAERVLGDLHTDVLVVKPEGFRRRIPRLPRGAQVVMRARPTL
jgi:universal stress protein E